MFCLSQQSALVNRFSDASRIDIYNGIMQNGSLLGVGLNNTEEAYPITIRPILMDGTDQYTVSTGQRLANVHNDFLQIWFELGWIGTCFFLFGIYAIWKLIKSKGNQLVPMAMGIAMIGLAVTALFNFPMYGPVSPMLLGAYVGVAEIC